MDYLILLILIAFSIWYLRLDKPRFRTFLEKSKLLSKVSDLQQFKVISRLEEESSVVQAHNKIADSLFISHQKKNNCQVVLLTSAYPREGKTTTAVNLALTMVKRNRKVLLVDADLRSPKVSRFLKLDSAPGLLELVNEKLSLEDTLRDVEGLRVLSAGSTAESKIAPVEFFASKGMKDLFKDLRAEFDLVIIDSPCIKAYRDALILSTLVDGIILVVEADKTPKRAILMAQEKIANIKGSFQGIILNKQINPVPFFIQDLLR